MEWMLVGVLVGKRSGSGRKPMGAVMQKSVRSQGQSERRKVVARKGTHYFRVGYIYPSDIATLSVCC